MGIKWIGNLGLLFFVSASAVGQNPNFNYTEAKVPAYDLPELMTLANGRPVKTKRQWEQQRRPEILELFQEHMYGSIPGDLVTSVRFQVIEQGEAFSGLGHRSQVRVYFGKESNSPFVDVLIYTPSVAGAATPCPLFVGLNFMGNHTTTPEEEVLITESWVRNDSRIGYRDHKATEMSRGASAKRWPVEMIMRAGFGVATAYYGDIDPDFDDGFNNGVHELSAASQTRDDSHWGSIATWAWGLSRIMDYLVTLPHVDEHRIAVLGHSRLGKTSLWAGATDRRFSLVISNDSGCGGAALSRRQFGETVKRINTSFPHWFCKKFRQYNDLEGELPLDQHMLIALMAPRPVYIASASEDLWADPRGEFLAGMHAAGVYRLFGLTGLGTNEHPPVNTPVGDRIGYHLREGKHDVAEYDWQQYIRFAKRHYDAR